MAKPPVSEQVQVNFRMPVDLRDRIKAAAEAEGVSMNHLIIDALYRRYPAPQTPSDIVNEVAAVMALYDKDLIPGALEALMDQAKTGKLMRRIEVERLMDEEDQKRFL